MGMGTAHGVVRLPSLSSMSLPFSCMQNSPSSFTVSPPTDSACLALAGGKCTQTESAPAQLPISRLLTENEFEPMVTTATSRCSSGLVRKGPPADTSRKRVRVAPSIARIRIDKLNGTQLSGGAAKKVCKHNSRTSENLARPNEESENLHFVSSSAATSPAQIRSQERGKIRQHDVEVEADNPAIANAQAVNSAAEQASEPPRKRQHAQPRPVGGLLDNPPSVTVESA